MFEAAIGDDVYGEDPTVNELEVRVAKLFEKEAAIFVPSGTMANLLASELIRREISRLESNLFSCSVMVHCDARGSEVICGNWSHVFKYEQGSSASVANTFVTNIPNLEDGTFSIDDVRRSIRGFDMHEPKTTMVVVEQTHNMSG